MAFREKKKDGTTVLTGMTPLDLYPIGSVYISSVNTNPASYFGGTWAAFATGRTLVGVDTSQTEFDTVLETGGAKNHTLTVDQMPAHSHAPAGTNNFVRWVGSGGNLSTPSGTQSIGQGLGLSTEGGGQPHNNMPPYITVYMWRRTA